MSGQELVGRISDGGIGGKLGLAAAVVARSMATAVTILVAVLVVGSAAEVVLVVASALGSSCDQVGGLSGGWVGR